MRRARPTGLTLLEVIIAATLLVVIMGMALTITARANSAAAESVVISDIANRANTLQEFFQSELRSAGNMDLNNGSFNSVTYSASTGYDFTTHTTGFSSQARVIRFTYDAGEAGGGDDDDDDDNDGLIDEGIVELLQDGVVLGPVAYNVSDEDFAIRFWESDGTAASGGQTPDVTDDEVRITFTIMARLPRADASGQPVVHTQTRELRVSLRI